MDDVIDRLQREIKAVDTPENRTDYQRFFKEKLEHPVGLRTPILRGVSNKVFKDIRSRDKQEILAVCDRLLAGGKRYMRFFALDWAGKVEKEYTRDDFTLFERWLKRYVDNWGTCDHLCGVLGAVIAMFPDLSARRKPWIASDNMWLRRAAAVALIEPVKRGILIKDVFRTAEALMADGEDLVQKGYGWMLKVAGDYFFEDVHRFVMKHRDHMPRTALRYAIEKWPAAKRKQAMRRT
jgi:3-methyladenine DNA glycosylase AlkD